MPRSKPKSRPTGLRPRGGVLALVPGRDRGAGLDGIVIGKLTATDSQAVSVVFPGNPSNAPVVARSTIALGPRDVGRDAALMFERGDWRRPVVLGLLNRPLPDVGRGTRDIVLDGERMVLTAEREIQIRCGKATITLTRAGKILIRGAYLLNRSSGVNKIKGGSVQIN